MEKACANEIETPTAQSDMFMNLLGNVKEPRLAEDCHILSPWRTSAVRARAPHQTDARRGDRLDTPPPPLHRSVSSITQNYDDTRPEQQHLPLRHQSASPGRRLYLRENIPNTGKRSSPTHAWLARRRPLPVPPLGRIAEQSGQAPYDAGNQKRRGWESDRSIAR